MDCGSEIGRPGTATLRIAIATSYLGLTTRAHATEYNPGHVAIYRRCAQSQFASLYYLAREGEELESQALVG